MTFSFSNMAPIGSLPPKPMQWPYGAKAEEEDWEFFPEAMKAWRSWRVVNHPIDPENPAVSNSVIMLQSISFMTEWTPKQEMIAQCMPMKRLTGPESPPKAYSHACPDLTHGCGIYSVKTEEQALEWKKFRVHDPVVWGQVNIWGHVYKFTKGYLSEFAYPSRIFVPDDLASWNHLITPEMLACELSETYGVEAVTL